MASYYGKKIAPDELDERTNGVLDLAVSAYGDTVEALISGAPDIEAICGLEKHRDVFETWLLLVRERRIRKIGNYCKDDNWESDKPRPKAKKTTSHYSDPR